MGSEENPSVLPRFFLSSSIRGVRTGAWRKTTRSSVLSIRMPSSTMFSFPSGHRSFLFIPISPGYSICATLTIQKNCQLFPFRPEFPKAFSDALSKHFFCSHTKPHGRNSQNHIAFQNSSIRKGHRYLQSPDSSHL